MEKQRWEESKKRRAEERRSEKRKSQKKEDACARKVGKSRNTVFFQWFVAPEGWKVGSLKWRVRSHLARWEMKSCTQLLREAHLQVKKLKGRVQHQPRLWKRVGGIHWQLLPHCNGQEPLRQKSHGRRHVRADRRPLGRPGSAQRRQERGGGGQGMHVGSACVSRSHASNTCPGRLFSLSCHRIQARAFTELSCCSDDWSTFVRSITRQFFSHLPGEGL